MIAEIHGVGIGLRGPHVAALLETDRALDFVEIVPENYVGRGGADRRTLDQCAERWPVLVHGVSTSIGGPDAFDGAYLDGLRDLLRRLRAPLYTDHLCFSSFGGFQSHQLLPLPHTDEAVRHAARRIRELRDRLDLPVAVENVTTYVEMPGSTMSAAAFVAAVVAEADCGLLLDVNNLFVNAKNLGGDAVAELDRLPLDRVVQIHAAGHEIRGGRWIDSHGAPIAEDVAAVLDEVLVRLGPSGTVPVLIERDLNLPPLDVLLDEADVLRARIAALPAPAAERRSA